MCANQRSSALVSFQAGLSAHVCTCACTRMNRDGHACPKNRVLIDMVAGDQCAQINAHKSMRMNQWARINAHESMGTNQCAGINAHESMGTNQCARINVHESTSTN
eukprot:1156043-Pelagomonas_calceolata.AAC.6